MIHFVFVPPVKTDTLTSLAIQRWLHSNGEECILVVKKGATEFFDKVDVAYITDSDWSGMTFNDEISVYFLHANAFYYYFLEKMSLLSGRVDVDKVYINFIPEGFGNAMWGERFTERLSRDLQSTKKFHLDKTISYGFKQHYIDEKFPSAEKVVIDYKYVIDAIEANTALRSISEQAVTKLDLAGDVIFIPFRPWCTSSFHGGMYDFGSTKDFSKIVFRLLSYFDVKSGSTIIFRPDFRYHSESQELLSDVAEKYDVKEVSESIFPNWMSLEPLFQSLVSNDKIESLKVLNFDSTTSIPVLFQAKESALPQLEVLFGCPLNDLKMIEGGSDFYQRKLKQKISMFKKHILSVDFSPAKFFSQSDESGFLKVSLRNLQQ